MLLKQIEYFIAIVEKNSFTLAAEECFISQSAISQQMQALESELGVKLFIRKNRKFTLTNAGEYFYRGGKDLLNRAQKLKDNAKLLGEDDELVLNIGYPRMYIGGELKQAIAEFSALYPETVINIERGNHEELYFKLRGGKLDIAINDQRRVFSDLYENFLLREIGCYAEVADVKTDSLGLHLNGEDTALPCILTASEAQRETERNYYANTLYLNDNFLFAETIDEARLLAIGRRGFVLTEGTNDIATDGLKHLPLYYGGRQIMRNYCAFWLKERANYYIEEFANILKKQF